MSFIVLMGHLGADAETRFTPSGQQVTTFRIATTVRKGGEDHTIWYRVTVWGDRYKNMFPHLKKGSALVVQGELTKAEVYKDQPSLEVTAETIRFSPFGRGEKTESKPAYAPVVSEEEDGLPF